MVITKNSNRIVVFVLLLVSSVFSNPSNNKHSIWTEVQINFPLSKKIETNLGKQIRYSFNTNLVKWHVTDLEMAVKINKNFKISTKYRFKNRRDAKQHVLYTNFYYKTKKQKLKFQYRLRYNKKLRYKTMNENILWKRDEDHIRNRIIIEYNINKFLVPYTGLEVFYLVNNDKYSNGFDIFRYYLGVEIDISKKQKVKISWVYEEVFNLGTLTKENIIKVQYSFDIK